MTPAGNAVGVMVVRIWVEPPDDALRARLTHTLDIGSTEQVSELAVAEEAIMNCVREWIDAFQAQSA